MSESSRADSKRDENYMQIWRHSQSYGSSQEDYIPSKSEDVDSEEEDAFEWATRMEDEIAKRSVDKDREREEEPTFIESNRKILGIIKQ